MRCTFQTISDMTELVTKQVQTTLHYQQHQCTAYCNQIVCHKKHVVQLCHYQDPTSTYPQHIMPHWRHCSKAGFRSVWTVLSNTAQLIRGPTEQWKEKGSNKEDVGAIFLFKRAPTFVNPVLLAVSHHYASELTALCTGHIYSCTATKATTIPVPYGNITSHMWSREQHVTITALELLTVTSYLWASPSCSYLK